MGTSKPKTALDYYDGRDLLPEGTFRISPSSFNVFMRYPHKWYREHVLGEKGFTGSTASVIGTIVHYVAEMYTKGEPVDKAEIDQYIANMEDNEEVDTKEVIRCYKPMAEVLINQYAAENMPSRVEEFISKDLGNKVYVAGSVDALFNEECVVDYKTYNSKTKPTSIPLSYKYQLLIYAAICKSMGLDIERIRLVYINRPIDGRYISEKTGKACGKIHPSEVTVLTEEITQDDFDFIDSVVELCKETYLVAKANPNLVHLLYRDMRLKLKV